MNLFSVDYLDKSVRLFKEAFRFKKYKAMDPFSAVITGLIMIPFVLYSFLLFASLVLNSFLFKTVRLPIDFLHTLVSDEGKQTRHATQFIIYLISWPVVFLLYFLVSFMVLWISVIYALTSCITYIWSLGGFKFHLYANEAEDISIEVNGKYSVLPLIFVLIQIALLIIVPIIHGVVLFLDLYYNYMEAYFIAEFVASYSLYYDISVLFSLLYSLIAFAPRPKSAKPRTEDAAIDAEIPVEIQSV